MNPDQLKAYKRDKSKKIQRTPARLTFERKEANL